MEYFGLAEEDLGLLVDLYELTMLQGYWKARMNRRAVFSLFFRALPEHRNFMLACGQEHAARVVPSIRFGTRQLDELAGLGMFSDEFLRWLGDLRFSGDIHALAEGTPVFANEPLLEVEAPLPEAQLLESFLMNYVNLELILASKAVRMVLVAGDRPVVDFGMRRMHGFDSAMRGVRAYHVAGLAGTSNVLGGRRYGVPVVGTMAHSFIQAYADEKEAFRDYARLYPGTTLLVDTYDTLAAVEKVIEVVRDDGLEVGAIRLDSGDLSTLSKAVRRRLDQEGLNDIRITVSGGLDEWQIRDLLAAGAPIDGFGVGTALGAVVDAPALDIAYKLTEYDGQPRLKNSPGKKLLPGRKQVWRFVDNRGTAECDEVTHRDETRNAEPLLHPVIVAGEASGPPPDLERARRRARHAVAHLPPRLLELDAAYPPYPVDISDRLHTLRREALATLGDAFVEAADGAP